jgi:hypothetical protein
VTAGQTLTIQQVTTMRGLAPTAASAEPSLRVSKGAPRSTTPPSMGTCGKCGRPGKVNADDGTCKSCQARGRNPKTEQREFHAGAERVQLPIIDPQLVLFGAWRSRSPKGIGQHYVHIPTGPRRPWQQRPHHLQRWQVDDAALPRNRRTRTAPGRLHPQEGTGVSLRCLVCLIEVRTLRHDQVCENCEQAWVRAGRVWGVDFDHFLQVRRTAQADYRMAATARYEVGYTLPNACHERPVRGPLADIVPFTRGNAEVFFVAWDNGVQEETSGAGLWVDTGRGHWHAPTVRQPVPTTPLHKEQIPWMHPAVDLKSPRRSGHWPPGPEIPRPAAFARPTSKE